MDNPPPRRAKLRIAAAGFALIGLGLNLLLLWWKVSNPAAGILGCGASGGCADVLASRWSQVFGLPVTVAGSMVYLAVLVCLARSWWRGLAACLAVLLGGTGWFVFVQAVWIGQYCPWCLAAHGIGLVVVATGCAAWPRGPDWRRTAALGAALGTVAALALALAQTFGPAPRTHRLENAAGRPSGTGVQAFGPGRKVVMAGGNLTFSVAALPHLGHVEAPHVLVEYFDYQCASCRVMRGYLDTLLARHPDKICLIVLPVPLDARCNDKLAAGEPEHPAVVFLARLALAVWRVAPAAFPAVHRAFFAEPAPSDPAALRLAGQLAPGIHWEDAMKDPWIDAVLAENIADREALSATSRHLPKLLLKDTRILHGLPSGQDDFLRVLENELGLQGKN